MSVIEAGGGEVVGDSPERRVEILSDHEHVHATWTRYAPHRDGADLHIHRRHTDLFYVLAGELTVRLGVDDERVTVPAGTLVRVPPLVVHGFRNAGDGELRYLNFHAPGERFADYLRAWKFRYRSSPSPALRNPCTTSGGTRTSVPAGTATCSSEAPSLTVSSPSST
jgi:mannose-6-phosphate isomerase-like protein (cupin superfamily)